MDIKTVLVTIVASLTIGLIFWTTRSFYTWHIVWNRSRKIYQWLKDNTRDELEESHKSLLEISNGTRLSEEQVREACLKNTKIMQSTSKPGNYSIWRVEPQSVYEKRGARFI
jgi:hypothetical protein